jgi:hypothetical protein
MFIVYLSVSSFLLFLDTMQKLLNNKLDSAAHLKRIFSSKGWLLASLLLVLLGLATSAQAASFGSNYVTIGGSNTTVNGEYFTNSNALAGNSGHSTAKSFRTIGNIGSFDRGTGSLLLSGEANTTSENGNGNAAVSVTLSYRVFPAGTPVSGRPAFTQVALSKTGPSTGNGANAVSKWKTPSAYQLLSSTSSAVNYTLELLYQVTEASGSIFSDNNSTNNYLANFSVNGAAPATWTGTTSTDWFTDSNWSTGVRPTSQTDVTIALGATRYPSISGTNGRIAQVRTLRLDKSSNPGSSTYILALNSGDLQIFGDFINPNSGFKQNAGFFTLAGTNQIFNGTAFTDVRIKGGGVKTLTTQMDILNSLTFFNDGVGVPGGVLATNTTSADDFNVTLSTSFSQIAGENETSYVLGVLRAFRTLTRGATNTYGNIGIDVNISLSSPEDPGSSAVTRRTDLSYVGAGLTSTSTSINRSFTFSAIEFPDNQVFSLVFRYLNVELNGLNAANLGFYRSVSGVDPFDNLNRTSSNPSTETVVSGIITGSLAATFTLGETNVIPLPVTLVSFTAAPTAQGAALLRWTTATETNNKGFGIERQLANGDTWQSVGYLASGNNAKGGTYEYTDKSLISAVSTPQAYYRLRQEDQDGTLSYSPVAVVARQAVLASTNLQLSPVPVTGANLSLTFAEAGQAGSEISIINTQGQRLYSYTTQASSDAALSLPVERLAAGVYIVSVRVAGQAVRHARFVKL